ncbi:MAG: hypothetical protein K0R65_2815 [Crocinitomicaceae bacterium]|jgi:hypothetical protein|nr:hypothetical protein [Crocinitomicaceae bacterium]
MVLFINQLSILENRLPRVKNKKAGISPGFDYLKY